MPEFIPFKAFIPSKNPESVSAPPYDVLSIEDCRKIVQKYPESFVKVSRPELEMSDDVNPYSEEVYEKALENYIKLKTQVPYILDDTPNYYIYCMEMNSHIQYGIAALASVKDYSDGRIKKHEKTRKDKEDDRTKHILKIHSHSGPVLLTYRDVSEINNIVFSITEREKPFISFETDSGVKHKIWRIADTRHLRELFSNVDFFYIADGHHRAASAARVASIINSNGFKDGLHNYFLAVAYPASQMNILPYNRLLLDLNGKTYEELKKFITDKFPCNQVSDIGKISLIPAGHSCLILQDSAYLVDLRTFKNPESSPEDNLDVAILQREILEPFFGISDPRTDKRIDFAGGIKGISYLLEQVRQKKAVAAFAMHPVSVEEVMSIADAGGIMPPKSTWFEPKLRDGLLLDEF